MEKRKRMEEDCAQTMGGLSENKLQKLAKGKCILSMVQYLDVLQHHLSSCLYECCSRVTIPVPISIKGSTRLLFHHLQIIFVKCGRRERIESPPTPISFGLLNFT